MGTREATRNLVILANLMTPTPDQFMLLYCHVARELIAFDGMSGSYRVDEIKGRSITVKAHYFEGRQGVTFEPGFVGFAGWSDDENVQPILKATVKWVEELTAGEPR